MIIKNHILFIFIISWASVVQANRDNTIMIPQTAQTDIRLTVYNNNLAVVRDTRKSPVSYSGKKSMLAFENVSSKILPETCTLEGVTAIEQNFNYDLLNTTSMLEKSVGKTITLARFNNLTHEESREEVTILGVENRQPIIKTSDGMIRFGANGTFLFDELAGDLWLKPTLTLTVVGAAKKELTLTCQSNGLKWAADYTAILNEREDRMAFSGWMTLNNNTKVDFPNAKLTLFAGNPRILQRRRDQRTDYALYSISPASGSRKIEMPEEEALSDYFLYEFPQRVNIKDRQEKQLALLSASSVEIKKEYYFRGRLGEQQQRRNEKNKALIRYVFNNTKSEGLGRAIPEGIVRFYQSDKDSERHFIGSGKIGNTAQGEKVTIYTGEAFGITLTKTISGKKRNPANGRYKWAVTYSLLNSMAAEIQLLLEESGRDNLLVIDTEQNDGNKISLGTYQWKITIPPKSSKELIYQVEQLKKNEY